MNYISNLAKKNLKFSKTKNILIILTIVLATCLITAAGIMFYSIQSSIINSAEEQMGNYHGVYVNVNNKQIEMLNNNRKIEKLGECIPFKTIKNKDLSDSAMELFYTDSAGADMTNVKLKRGNLPQKSNEIALESWVLDKLKVKSKIGESIHIKYESNKSIDFILSGILSDDKIRKQQNDVIGVVSKKLVTQNSSKIKTACYVRVKNHRNIMSTVSDIGHSIGLKDENIKTNSLYISAVGGDPSLLISFLVIALIIIIATMVVIYNIFYVSVIERIKQFGLLSAIGATKKQIRKVIFKEGFTLSIIAIPIGIIFAHVIYYIVRQLLISKYSIEIKSSPYIIIISALISLLAVVISLRKPEKLSSRISPVESMRYSGIEINSKKKERNSIKKISISKIAHLNLWRNKKRTIMTMISLTMSGILFIVICTVLKSMNIYNLTKQDFKHEFSLTSTETEGNPLNDKMINNIKNVKGVKNVSTEKYTGNISVDNLSCGLYGYDDYLLSQLKKYLIAGKISSEELKSKDEVLVVTNYDKNDNRICKYKVGDKINLSIQVDKNGKQTESIKKQFTVAGIVSKNIVGLGWEIDGYNLITHEDVFTRGEFKDKLASANDNKMAGVYIDIDSSKFESIKNKLKSVSQKDNRIFYDSYTDYKKEIESQYMGIQIIAMSFIGIIALIGILNLINTMITSILTRKKEYGMLQAVGLSDKQLRKMLQIEGIYYSLGSSLISIIFGTSLGYLCFKLFKKSGADYAEYKLPLGSILVLILAFAIITILITYLIENKLKKESIIDRIRYSE
ncbi:ABC transporter permease [Clostridium ljungdahlii]|uniref:ABC transporter permease YtrF n=1 Tax=Clostridium ljungdahlii TaxID=1538 RepID=A0A170NE78_9CLOT|nr:ABC transporter permease [Clostridium ljungdahlii]OAA85233.1 ABC transporter permease YtrF precursor [Clostridium ljungdahlii]